MVKLNELDTSAIGTPVKNWLGQRGNALLGGFTGSGRATGRHTARLVANKLYRSWQSYLGIHGLDATPKNLSEFIQDVFDDNVMGQLQQAVPNIFPPPPASSSGAATQNPIQPQPGGGAAGQAQQSSGGGSPPNPPGDMDGPAPQPISPTGGGPEGGSFLDSSWLKKAGAEGNGYNMAKGGKALADAAQQALGAGHKVELVTDNGRRTIPITSVSGGMLTDAEGQPWGSMSLAADGTGKEGLRITPGGQSQATQQPLTTPAAGATAPPQATPQATAAQPSLSNVTVTPRTAAPQATAQSTAPQPSLSNVTVTPRTTQTAAAPQATPQATATPPNVAVIPQTRKPVVRRRAGQGTSVPMQPASVAPTRPTSVPTQPASAARRRQGLTQAEVATLSPSAQEQVRQQLAARTAGATQPVSAVPSSRGVR